MKKTNKTWLLWTLPVLIVGLCIAYLIICLTARGQCFPYSSQQVAFTLFGRKVAWYGITMFLGFTASIYFSCLKMYKYGISIEPFYWYAIIAIPTAIVGARTGSCIIGQTPWADFFVNFGQGLAIEWGVTFTVIVGIIFFPLILRNEKYYKETKEGQETIRRQVSMWLYVDCVVPAILIGQIIGRFGNYINGELTGPVTTDPNWINFMKIFFPRMEIDGSWYLPVFFFEQIGNIVGLLLIYFVCEFITSKKIRKVGSLGILYFLWYGIVRLIMTPLRMAGGRSDGETVNLITTIVWIVAGVIMLLLNTLLIPKYCRKYRVLFVSTSAVVYFFKRIFKGWDNNVLQQQYQFAKSKFVRRKEDMFWYNGY